MDLSSVTPQNFTIGGTLRTYRLAVAATGEYTTFNGGTKTSALMAITASVNQINAIFERELSVHFNLVADEMNIIYTDAGNDPYPTTTNPAHLLGPNQFALDHHPDATTGIGNGNYDIRTRLQCRYGRRGCLL